MITADFWIDIAPWLIGAWWLAFVACGAWLITGIVREQRAARCRRRQPLAPIIPLDLSRERRRQVSRRRGA